MIKAKWWNLGFQFVRLYHRLFTRITRGASRLQEVLADRVAAYQYGPEALEEGLRHFVRRSIEMPLLINQESSRAVKRGPYAAQHLQRPTHGDGGTDR